MDRVISCLTNIAGLNSDYRDTFLEKHTLKVFNSLVDVEFIKPRTIEFLSKFLKTLYEVEPSLP
jgi:hypothetical protein